MADSVDPDQTAPFGSSLIWVYTVCLGNFVSKFVYLLLNVQVNNFSVMLGRLPVFLGLTSTKNRIKFLAQGCNTVKVFEKEFEILEQ